MNISTSYGIARSKKTWLSALLAAGMLTIMLTAQLFGYESLPPLLGELLAANMQTSTLLSAIIVFTELLALPYLLSMNLSRLFRYMSATFGFLVSGFWLFVSLTNAHASNSGIFSESLTLPGGLFAAVWSFITFVCVCGTILADSKFRHATLEKTD